MKNIPDDVPKQVALFRYGVISDLIHLPRGKGSRLMEKLRQKAEKSYRIPNSRQTSLAAETIRDWLKNYRKGGFDALRPKIRRDAGKPRRLPVEVIDVLLSIKEAKRNLTVAQVIVEARTIKDIVPDDLALPLSTVHRHLKQAGLMDKEPQDPSDKDRRRFAYKWAGELWMSDVMHGPAITASGRRKRKTYLIAFLDDATRVVPFAAFRFSEATRDFLTIFREALVRRGIPKRLYVDNGSAYRSEHLSLVCAQLGITLIHARPYKPQGKGKQERFFRRLRQQFLRVNQDVKDLDELNRRLRLWLEREYHRTPHRGLHDITPFDAWALKGSQVRLVGPEIDLGELFLFEDKRKVHNDRTISLHGHIYEVDAALVGQTVHIRYDPDRLGQPVDIWHQGKKIQSAKIVDVYQNCHVKRDNERKMLSPSIGPNEPVAGIDLHKLDGAKDAGKGTGNGGGR